MALTPALNTLEAAFPAEGVIGVAAFTGAGGSAPTGAATTIVAAAANLAGRATPTITRNGTGDVTYTLAVNASPSKAYMVLPVADGTTDLDATLRSIAVTSGALVVRVLTKTAAGVATDMTTADNLRILIVASNSTAG